MSGTVNISRDIWDDKAFKPEPFTEREAWIWMVMEASYKDRAKPVGKIWVDLRRGQLACSVRFMCDAWQWSKSRVDRFLKRLENRDMIGTHSGTGVNVITICKYDEYQNKPNVSGTAKPEKRDSSGTAAGQQRDKPNKGVIQDVIQGKEEPIGSLSSGDDPKPLDEISQSVSAYNIAAKQSGWPTVAVLSKSRRSSLAARLRECGGLAGWESALAKAQSSNHCCGQNDRGWVANFDFLIRQSSFVKLMEGNYDNRPSKHQPSTNGSQNGADPALEQALRLAGIGQA